MAQGSATYQTGQPDQADGTVQESVFHQWFPVPYRAALIIAIGIWAWGFNLKFLSDVRIDVHTLIRYTSKATPGNPSYNRIFRLALTATISLGASLIVFWIVTRQDPDLVRHWQVLPLSYLVFLAVLFALPMRRLSKNGRYRFLSTLRRVSVGGIAQAQDGKFGDILLADALTSYSKVLADLAISICMLVTGESSTARIDKRCGGGILYPLVLCYPSAIRLVQCLIEFRRVRQNPTASSGWGGQHLANALKYATAFPVIILSLRSPSFHNVQEKSHTWGWVIAVFVNSSYSWYWDVAKDWDLSIFDSELRGDIHQPWGLRPRIHFPSWAYYVVIVVDLLLRFTWCLKVSSHMEYYMMVSERIIYTLQVLEVFRRWIWIFFRVETEWVRSNKDSLDFLSDHILLGPHEREREHPDKFVVEY